MSELQAIVPPPEEIKLRKSTSTLELHWPDGRISSLDSGALRRACACSSCTNARRRGTEITVPDEIRITDVQLMGVSGLQLFFSDGHSRGHYPWRFLLELGEAA